MSTAAPVFEAISTATKRKQREARQQFHNQLQALIRDAAHGVKICERRADEAAQLLELAQMDAEQFTAAVERHKQREADAALRNKLPELRAELRQAEEALQSRKAAYEAFIARERPLIAELFDKRNAIDAECSRAEFASARLFNSYRNPLVAEQEQELSRACIAKQEQIAAQQERIKHQCTLPLLSVTSDLRKEVAFAEASRSDVLPRDPRNNTRIATLRASKANLEARLQAEERILNGLMAEESYLQSELQALALKHYEV